MRFSVTPYRNESDRPSAIISSEVLEVGKAGQKLLAYLVDSKLLIEDKIVIEPKKMLSYYITKFDDASPNLSITRGIKDLLKAQIIAEATERGSYFINRAAIKQ